MLRGATGDIGDSYEMLLEFGDGFDRKKILEFYQAHVDHGPEDTS